MMITRSIYRRRTFDPAPVSPRPAGTEGWWVVAGMATHGTRIATAGKAIESIARQVDELIVNLNGETSVPDHLPRWTNIHYRADGSDNGAASKLRGLHASVIDVAFGVDDDLYYPHDYVAHSLAHVLADPSRTYCYHGVRLHADYTTYRKSRTVWSGLRGLSTARACHVLGTGTSFWSTRYAVGPRELDCPWPVRIDTPCGWAVIQRGGSIVCPPRRDPWIGSVREADRTVAICRMTTLDASPIDDYVRETGLHLVPLADP
jgi:hypothetical protein